MIKSINAMNLRIRYFRKLFRKNYAKKFNSVFERLRERRLDAVYKQTLI
jgi:hypothetical protein